jgi:hypothetical protein
MFGKEEVDSEDHEKLQDLVEVVVLLNKALERKECGCQWKVCRTIVQICIFVGRRTWFAEHGLDFHWKFPG